MADKPSYAQLEEKVRKLEQELAECKGARAALKESEQKFRVLFEFSPIAIALSEMDTGRLVAVNQSFCRDFGADAEQLIGYTTTELNFYSQKEREQVRAKLLENGSVHGLEMKFNTLEGTERYTKMFGSLVRLEGREYALLMFYDITDQLLTEQVLRENEERFRFLAENAQDMIFKMSLPSAVYDYVSPSAVNITGYSPEEFYSDPHILHKTIHPDWKSYLKEHWENLMQGVVPSTHEFKTIHKSGQIKCLHQRNVAIRDQNGQLIALHGIVSDITQRRSAEEKLSKSEERHRKLLETTSSGFWELDENAVIVDVNQALCEILGFTGYNLLGKSPLDFVTEARSRDFRNNMAKTISSLNHKFETELIRSDGTPVYVHFESTALCDAKNRVCGSFAFIVDLSEQKKKEQDRAKLQSQLVQAQKMESIGRLSSGIAHDFNNMLVAILGYTDMLAADPEFTEIQRKKIEYIRQAGLRSRDLVKQLLAFSRKQDLKMENLDLNDLLQNFKNLLRKSIREEIEIEYALSPEDLCTHADRGQIEQVLLNLGLNAQDAISGAGTLRIETELVDLNQKYRAKHRGLSPGHYILLRVSDTGCGMDKSTRKKIFEPFFSTKSRDEGTGLGLSTVYGIIKQHMGNIRVSSEPGKGTTFKIYLSSAPCSIQEEDKALPVEQNSLRGRERILVVEDNELVRELTVTALQNQGYKVYYAASGSQCLDMFKNGYAPFDLLLTDVIMPDMNGKKLYEQIVRKHQQIRVIFISGYSENIIQNYGVLDEEAAFIQKPFSIQNLYAKVREVLDK